MNSMAHPVMILCLGPSLLSFLKYSPQTLIEKLLRRVAEVNDISTISTTEGMNSLQAVITTSSMSIMVTKAGGLSKANSS